MSKAYKKKTNDGLCTVLSLDLNTLLFPCRNSAMFSAVLIYALRLLYTRMDVKLYGKTDQPELLQIVYLLSRRRFEESIQCSTCNAQIWNCETYEAVTTAITNNSLTTSAGTCIYHIPPSPL